MQLYRFNGQSVLHLFVMLLMLIGPLSTTFINKPVVVILFCAALMCVFFSLILQKPLRIWHIAAWPSGCYLALMLWALFAIILSRDVLTGTYLSEVIIGRLFTLVTAVLSLFIINWWLTSATEKQLKQALWTAFTILLIFILLGIWQFIGNVLGIKFFIATRDWMHGVPDSLKAILPKRLTSIAEEPNFLSPLLIEYLVLVFYIFDKQFYKKTYLIFIGLFVLIFSFSGGAYINVFLLVSIFWIYSITRNVTKGIVKYRDLIFIFFIILIFLFMTLYGQTLIEFVYYKFESESSGASTRSQFFTSVINLYCNDTWLSMFFGHGLATMSVLPQFGLPLEEQLFRMSNNFYLDLLWEGGIFGVLLLLLMFSLFIIVGFRYSTVNRDFEFGMILSLHLVIVSFYRSEYLSPHFIFLVALVMIFYRMGSLKSGEHDGTIS